MLAYSTCSGCDALLHIIDDEPVHTGCTPKLTRVETLALQWRDAVVDGDRERESELYRQIEALDNRPPRLGDAALIYASWGWPVFPLQPRSKRPACRRGFKDATTDADRIRAYWQRRPDANVGLPTGRAFNVIDIDPPKGAHSYAQLLDSERLPDSHGRVATPSGGMHLYVLPATSRSHAGLLPGVDYRALGGYVVAPPSTLGARGRSWSWTFRPSPVITGAKL